MFMLRRAGAGGSPAHRVAQATRLMATGGKAVVEQMANHCSAAGVFSDRLGLDAEVRAGLEQAYARWDGKGVPADLEGDGLSLAARVSHVAEACEVVQRLGGLDQRRRHGAGAQRHALRSRDRRRGVHRSRRPVRRHRRGGRRRVPRRRAGAAAPDDRGRARPQPRGDRRLLRPALRVLRRSLPRHRRPRRRGVRAALARGRRGPARVGAPRWCTTSGASACPAPCGASRVRSARPTGSACASTCTTWSGSSSGPNRCAGSACSRPRTTSGWTAPATTAGSAARCCRRRRACSPRPTPTTR